MPVAPEIVCATGSYRLNAGIFEKTIADLAPEDWGACPCEASNSILWIAGHIVWARSRALATLGSQWSRPWLPLFARGSKQAEASLYPSPEEVVEAWRDVRSTLDAALESAAPEALSASGPDKAPSFDGKVSGFLGFLATHESYHVGQVAYLRRWRGRIPVSG